MSYLHIPRYHPRQLVRVSTVYVSVDEPPTRALARVEAIRRDPRRVLAPTYTVVLLAGAHAGETHELPEAALAPLGG
jgi:hypothetical protein